MSELMLLYGHPVGPGYSIRGIHPFNVIVHNVFIN